ncbi:hypothetical protein BMS3Bbin04_01379 [bacterium BMS3Bbin04]|nr:hypothetical protein BMS3Bbin04_01379 [bacterium BMS3Bbin04]
MFPPGDVVCIVGRSQDIDIEVAVHIGSAHITGTAEVHIYLMFLPAHSIAVDIFPPDDVIIYSG